jgi:hypothetical protein
VVPIFFAFFAILIIGVIYGKDPVFPRTWEIRVGPEQLFLRNGRGFRNQWHLADLDCLENVSIKYVRVKTPDHTVGTSTLTVPSIRMKNGSIHALGPAYAPEDEQTALWILEKIRSITCLPIKKSVKD